MVSIWQAKWWAQSTPTNNPNGDWSASAARMLVAMFGSLILMLHHSQRVFWKWVFPYVPRLSTNVRSYQRELWRGSRVVQLLSVYWRARSDIQVRGPIYMLSR